jgi:iron-sulfur cluster assembly protein
MLAQNFDPSVYFLRMGVLGGGCAGLSYSLDFDAKKEAHDKEFEFDFPGANAGDPKLKIIVDPKSYLYLNGTTLDYATRGLTGGFVFNNPNAKTSCGCGTSFSA